MKQAKKIIGWSVFSIYLILTLTAVFFHEPWEDELQPWIMARELSAGEIIYWMRYEGHFALWHLILHPFAASGFPLDTLNLVSWILCVTGTGLLFFRSRLPLWSRCLMLFSCALLYYYPVVARTYSLIPLTLYFLTVLYPVRLRHPFRYAFAVLLLMYIHPYLAGMAGMLGLFFLFDLIRHNRRLEGGLRLRKTFLPPAVMLAGALAAFLMVIPAVGESHVVPKTLAGFFGQEFFVPIVNVLKELPDGRHTYYLAPILGRLTVSVLYWLCMAAGLTVLWKTCRSMVWIWLGGLLWMLMMSALVYPMLMHRGYLPYLFLIFALGLPLSGKLRKEKKMGGLNAAAGICIAVLSVMTWYDSWVMFGNEIRYSFSNQGQMAAFIGQHVPKDARIVTFPPDLISSTFPAFLPDHHFYDCGTNRPYRVFKRRGKYPRELNDAVLHYYAAGSPEPYYLLFYAPVIQYYRITPKMLTDGFRHFKVEFVYQTYPPAFFSAHEDYILFKVTPLQRPADTGRSR